MGVSEALGDELLGLESRGQEERCIKHAKRWRICGLRM